jgi:hypothetical protein
MPFLFRTAPADCSYIHGCLRRTCCPGSTTPSGVCSSIPPRSSVPHRSRCHQLAQASFQTSSVQIVPPQPGAHISPQVRRHFPLPLRAQFRGDVSIQPLPPLVDGLCACQVGVAAGSLNLLHVLTVVVLHLLGEPKLRKVLAHHLLPLVREMKRS